MREVRLELRRALQSELSWEIPTILNLWTPDLVWLLSDGNEDNG